ncbi:endonuclease/exonuclease/phosphatase [Streptomyces agglomeratus]|uniref:Endonuclease/exonuclease/phosphatase n=1 Tax=Streptomyces agglomeratus TaxID=285458 RepID=A0A1E5PD52_9ACTN|nr:endonuclease/exonuclease/phosphatase family protein [Streptomyces agglomeratus]OEJ27468.1 endonuclease/exonuclease/phosphatase [Streptomyces agglomeratus]OEJ38475.1 endonuclease/exonuclease/phosphatase [Streptomyces agglomeratus]OEJ47140.1 endonuclease/exonuclease/phosphatase [Streptomyces agglomeratus]OEJ51003.1 endonuclease/exonuclease/phosphatase [Streptomyces agglomeratus]OEJ58373.1 endonuclease/exonuclease/phosphatase [Streptomyces agglomeratus]
MTARSSSLPRSAAVAAVVASALAAGLLASSSSASASATVSATAPAQTRIHDIQGTTRISPLVGQQVTDVSGIVTGVRTYGSKGFWFQDTEADADAATSEGIFVFTGSAPTVAVGDAVKVSGTVGEYIPGGTASGNQSLTQISKPAVTVVSSGNALPAPVAVSAKSVPSAYAPEGDPAAGGSINALPLNPSAYALDYYESLEGTSIRIGSSRVVGATDPYAELWVTVKPHENDNRRGGAVYGSYTSQNTGRLQIQQLAPVSQQPFPKANVGDVLSGTTEGPLDFNQFGGYTLTARTLGTVTDRGLERESTRPQRRGELAVATYNVENLDPGDPQDKFDALAAAVVDNLASPDILALEEIQDDNGAKNDGTVSAEETLKKFTAAIAAAGGPSYAWRTVDPVNNKDGGEPGGNIRQVFLFNPERVAFTDRGAGDATTATAVVQEKGRAALTLSPGRIDPANAAWENSRKPLAGEFTFRGRTVFVIANHFGSKGGDEGLASHHQPPVRKSEVKRLEQAQSVNAFVKDILKAQRNADVLVLGDINDFEFSATTKALTADGALYPAVKSLPRSERYSYVFQGNSQVLDQILTSPSIGKFSYDSVHINAEFAEQNSDHDPQVLRFRP